MSELLEFRVWPRYLKPKVKQALSRSPAVYLTGARQVGKTTLALEIAREEGMAYLTLDDPTLLAAARRDPSGIVAGLKGPAVIDEVQRVPELLLAIKATIDEDRRPGRFLLTGSTSLPGRSDVAAALVGRAEYLTLYPLAEAEIEKAPSSLVEALFQDIFPYPPGARFAAEEVEPRLRRGGYPPAAQADEAAREAWMRSYLAALIERELLTLSRIEHPEGALDLLRLLAQRTATPQNIASMGSEIGLPTATARRYAELFERVFLLLRVPAWAKNLAKRLTKRPKILMNDPALALFLALGSLQALTPHPEYAGRVLETFALLELTKQASWSEPAPRLYHYRTASGSEVDVVLEDEKGRVVGVEVKRAKTLGKRDLKGLWSLKEAAGERFLRGVVLYLGESILPLGENLYALPFSALWRPAL